MHREPVFSVMHISNSSVKNSSAIIKKKSMQNTFAYFSIIIINFRHSFGPKIGGEKIFCFRS